MHFRKRSERVGIYVLKLFECGNKGEFFWDEDMVWIPIEWAVVSEMN